MALPIAIRERFIKEYGFVLVYAASRFDIMPFMQTKGGLEVDLERLREARDQLMDNRHIARDFLSDKKFGQHIPNNKAVNSVHHVVFGDWLVLEYKEDYAICQNVKSKQFYHTKWLNERLDHHYDLPIRVNFGLVPYEGFWIMDGFFHHPSHELSEVEAIVLRSEYNEALSNNLVVKNPK